MYENKEQNFTLVKTLICSVLMFLFTVIFFLFVGICNVDAATWVEFRTEGDNYLCGSNQDSLSCTYSTNVIGYNVIIEEIELKANKTYELEIYWNLQTAITPGNQSGYINDNNWQTFTATIDGKFWGVNGPTLPTANRTWQKLSQERIFGIGDVPDYASYYYKYTNVFELASDQNYERLYFEVRKRQQWTSIGMPTWYTNVYTPLVVFTEFTYTLSEIGDNGVANIIASGNKNAQDIMNNQNENADKIVDALEGEDLEDTTPVDKTKEEEYKEAENALLNENNLNLLNDIDISLDSNSNIFIWNMVTSIINSHALIFGFVITILSLGVLKLVLNR